MFVLKTKGHHKEASMFSDIGRFDRTSIIKLFCDGRLEISLYVKEANWCSRHICSKRMLSEVITEIVLHHMVFKSPLISMSVSWDRTKLPYSQ